MEITQTGTRYILINENGKYYYAEHINSKKRTTIVKVAWINDSLVAWDTLGKTYDEYGEYAPRFSKNAIEFFYKNSIKVNHKWIPVIFTVTPYRTGQQLNELEYERYFRNVTPQIEELV